MKKAKEELSETPERETPKREEEKSEVVIDPESIASRERAHAIKVINNQGGK